jgi:hypothetical protein
MWPTPVSKVRLELGKVTLGHIDRPAQTERSIANIARMEDCLVRAMNLGGPPGPQS